MKSKLDVTLTDFIYAIVVGAAFQKIDAPILSFQNLYLFIAFVVIIDDWVLYHVQAEKVPDSKTSFAKSLVIDSFVLLTWYCAAVSGAHSQDGPSTFIRDFYFALLAFYFFTLTWELLFHRVTNNSGRVGADIASLCVVIVAYLTHTLSYFTYVAFVLAALWFGARAFAWRKVVFDSSRIESA